jgi:hypothetical protein
VAIDRSWLWISWLITGIGTSIVAGGLALEWGSLRHVLYAERAEGSSAGTENELKAFHSKTLIRPHDTLSLPDRQRADRSRTSTEPNLTDAVLLSEKNMTALRAPAAKPEVIDFSSNICLPFLRSNFLR